MKAKIENLDLNDVALFVHVVRAASFWRCGGARGSGLEREPADSARLETQLGTRLLERTTRRLRLTEVGAKYFEHAERALDELTEGGVFVRSQQAVPRGRVRITAPVGLGPMLTRALAAYLVKTPLVSIEIDLTERRVDLLAEGFDIAVRAGPFDSADFVARKIFETTRCLFASKAYLDRKGRPRRLADLVERDHDLIATRASPSGAVWELVSGAGAQLKRHRFAFKPRLFVNELMAARTAAIDGIGIAYLPAGQVEKGSVLERVLPQYSGEAGGLSVMYPARRSLTAAVRTCVDHLVANLSLGNTH